MAAEQTLGWLVLNTTVIHPAQLGWYCYFQIIPGFCISVPHHPCVFCFNLKTILSLRCFVESKNLLTPGRSRLSISLLQRVVLQTKPEDHSDPWMARAPHGGVVPMCLTLPFLGVTLGYHKERTPLLEPFVFGQVGV